MSSYAIAMILYTYLVLFGASLLAFHDAPLWAAIILPAMLLGLPSMRDRGKRLPGIHMAATAANALIFASVAYAMGRGVAVLSAS
jgi:hypothetical protein